MALLAAHRDLDAAYLEGRAAEEGLAQVLAETRRQAEALRREAEGSSP